jgi:hypothetical protein
MPSKVKIIGAAAADMSPKLTTQQYPVLFGVGTTIIDTGQGHSFLE